MKMMRKWKNIMAGALLSAMLCVGGTALAAPVPAPDADIHDLLYQYRQDASVQQVLFVNIGKGSEAHVRFYEKDAASGAWTITRDCDAYAGKNGGGKTKEGDAKTPYGIFNVRTAFGIKANPGTTLPYIDVTNDTYACGCEQYYNQIIDAKKTGHVCAEDGEHMIKYSPHYNYGMAIDYNADNTLWLGSGMFIHCIGAKPWTGGCVALPEDDMSYILQHSNSGIKVIIQQYLAPEA